MNTDQGKLFIGGISWETTEQKLKEYFQVFGDVAEVVVMKDRATGRARGFGFVVFSDPAVADLVIRDKHIIDGRLVEAKKAVPREEQQIVNRNNTTNLGNLSPSSIARTKKIFVGGLASSVKESDFREYFEQFGAITDVVVMYDQNTQRPRGFGFITFDSEDAVNKVLLKTFHELNDKMVEVKRAIPKDLSTSLSRHVGVGLSASPRRGWLYYAQGLSSSPGSPRSYRMDTRFGSPTGNRFNHSPSYGALRYRDSVNHDEFANGIYNTGPYGRGELYDGAGCGVGSTTGAYGRMGAGFGNSAANTVYESPYRRSVWGNEVSNHDNLYSFTSIHGSGEFLNSNNIRGKGTWGAHQAIEDAGTYNSFYGNPQIGYGGNGSSYSTSVSQGHSGQMSGSGNAGGAFGVSRIGSTAGSHSYLGDLYGTLGYGGSTWRATPADTLKSAQPGSGSLQTALYSLDSSKSNDTDAPNSNDVYKVSGAQSYNGVAV